MVFFMLDFGRTSLKSCLKIMSLFLLCSLVGFVGLIIIIYKWPAMASSLHFPIAITACLTLYGMVTEVVLLLIVVWRISAKESRWFSLVLLLAGVLSIEYYYRVSSSATYLNNYSNFRIIEPDSLKDFEILSADENGITRFNLNTPYNGMLPHPLNTDGFRCKYNFTQPAIDSLKQIGKKVYFFVGDSYTFGLRADSGKSFAELFDASPDKAVLNASFPGTDLWQYAAVVKKYITNGILKPQHVVVFICGANDLFFTRKGTTPFVPQYYGTNAGNIVSSFPSGEVAPTARQAYECILSKLGIDNTHFFTLIAFKSLLKTTRASSLLFTNEGYQKFVGVIENLRGDFLPATEYRQAMEIIHGMKKQCAEAGVPITFILLPGEEMLQKRKAAMLEGVVQLDLNAFNLKEDFNPWDGDHPNNSGHRKIFEQLQRILP